MLASMAEREESRRKARVKSEELKPIPATLSRKPFFVGHIAGDGCAPDNLAPLFKAAVRVELKATLRTFLLKCLCHTSVLRVDLSDTFFADVDDFLIVEPSGVALLGAQDALHDVSVPRIQVIVLPYRPRLDDVP